MKIEDLTLNLNGRDKFPILGIEKEGWVISTNEPDEIVNVGSGLLLVSPFQEPEFGRDQIEIQTKASEIRNLSKIQEEVETSINYFYELNEPHYKIKFKPIREDLAVNSILVNNSNSRYPQLNEHIKMLHGGQNNYIGDFNFNSLEIMALFNATQLNIRAKNEEEAVGILNAGLMMSPEIVALSGEESFIDNKPTGYHNFRMLAWEKMLRQEDWFDAYKRQASLRVGLPTTYFDSFEHYLSYIKPIKPVLNPTSKDIFEIIKNYWGATRIKVKPNLEGVENLHDLVVEFRDQGSMSNIYEDMAVVAYTLGRSFHIQDQILQGKMQLKPLTQVRQELIESAKTGLHYSKNKLLNEIETSALGLEILGYDSKSIQRTLDPIILKAKEYERKAS